MNYKLSYYTVFTDPVDAMQYRVVYSTRSGKAMMVTRDCYEFLQQGLIDYIPVTIKEKLVKNQVIVEETENELDTITMENKEFVNQEGPGKDLYEVIQPTAMCQLGCYYCGQQHTKTNLKDDLVEKIVERILTKFNRGNYRGIFIGWFGGEPLIGLPQMRAINKKLRTYCAERDIPLRGKIVTNGLSLKENIFLELVRDFNIISIEVTLDGTAEYHDKHRYLKNNTSSFDLIYKNLRQILTREDFASHRCSISVRCNVDEKNIDGVKPLIQKLAADGLHQKIAYLYFMKIYSWGGNDAHKGVITKERFAQYELEWAALKIKLGYPDAHHLPKRKKQLCIAVGGASEMYDAYGNIYNCTEVSYTDFYKDGAYTLGKLSENHLQYFENKPLNNWHKEIQDGSQKPCHYCRLLPVCGGSCPKSWKEGNAACPSFKYNIRQDLELYYIQNKAPLETMATQLDEFVSSLPQREFVRLT